MTKMTLPRDAFRFMLINGLIPGYPRVESFSDFVTGRTGKNVRFLKSSNSFEFEIHDDSDAIMFKLQYQDMEFEEILEIFQVGPDDFHSGKYLHDNYLRYNLVHMGLVPHLEPKPWYQTTP